LLNLEKSRELTLEGSQVPPFIVQGRILGRHDRGKGAEEGKIDEVPRGRSLRDSAPFLPLPMGPVNPVVENKIGSASPYLHCCGNSGVPFVWAMRVVLLRHVAQPTSRPIGVVHYSWWHSAKPLMVFVCALKCCPTQPWVAWVTPVLV